MTKWINMDLPEYKGLSYKEARAKRWKDGEELRKHYRSIGFVPKERERILGTVVYFTHRIPAQLLMTILTQSKSGKAGVGLSNRILTELLQKYPQIGPRFTMPRAIHHLRNMEKMGWVRSEKELTNKRLPGSPFAYSTYWWATPLGFAMYYKQITAYHRWREFPFWPKAIGFVGHDEYMEHCNGDPNDPCFVWSDYWEYRFAMEERGEKPMNRLQWDRKHGTFKKERETLHLRWNYPMILERKREASEKRAELKAKKKPRQQPGPTKVSARVPKVRNFNLNPNEFA